MPPSTREIPHAESPDPSFLTTSGPTPISAKCGESVNPYTDSGNKPPTTLQKQPMVVLTRLSPNVIRTLLAPTLENQDREDDSSLSDSSHLDSDTQWKPDADSSDSDFSISNYNSGSNKRRKLAQKKGGKIASTHKASTKTGAQSNAEKTSTPKANENTSAKSNTEKKSTPSANTNGNGIKTLLTRTWTLLPLRNV